MEKIKNVLEKYVNASVFIQSPYLEDVERFADFDEDGKELVSYLPCDYAKKVEALGSIANWSLNALVKAGVNPNFSIHTGFSTRLDGYGGLQAASADAISILDNVSESESESESKIE